MGSSDTYFTESHTQTLRDMGLALKFGTDKDEHDNEKWSESLKASEANSSSIARTEKEEDDARAVRLRERRRRKEMFMRHHHAGVESGESENEVRKGRNKIRSKRRRRQQEVEGETTNGPRFVKMALGGSREVGDQAKEVSLATKFNNIGGNDAMWVKATSHLRAQGILLILTVFVTFGAKERGQCLYSGALIGKGPLWFAGLRVWVQNNLWDGECGVHYCSAQDVETMRMPR